MAQRNRFIRLRGHPTKIEKGRQYSYLLFGEKLRVAIKHARLPLFKSAGVNINHLLEHRLILRGWLGLRHGMPYMKLDHPYQLEKIE